MSPIPSMLRFWLAWNLGNDGSVVGAALEDGLLILGQIPVEAASLARADEKGSDLLHVLGACWLEALRPSCLLRLLALVPLPAQVPEARGVDDHRLPPQLHREPLVGDRRSRRLVARGGRALAFGCRQSPARDSPCGEGHVPVGLRHVHLRELGVELF